MTCFNIEKYAIKLLSCVLNNKEPDLPDDSLNWAEFKLFCEKHCISNIVAYSLNKLNIDSPDDIKLYFDEIVYQSVAKEAIIDVEINRVCDEFENRQIKFMPLKGFVIKNFYPQPDMRSMGDVDILVEDNNKAVDVMISLGFNFKSSENLHDTYFKKPFINVELHSSLFDEELTKLYSYFGKGFEKAELLADKKFTFKMTDENFYIFLIAHLAKHFKRTGTGIRSVMDIYVYLNSHSDLNFDYINNELQALNLLKFEKNIKAIAFNWFKDNIIDDANAVESYILSSGVYGTLLNLELNRFLQNENQNKFKYFIKVIFPDLAYMSARYSQLKKRKYLLPAFWIIRIFQTIFKSFGSVKYRLSSVFKSDKKSGDKFKDFN